MVASPAAAGGLQPLLARGITARTLEAFDVAPAVWRGVPAARYPVYSARGRRLAWRYKALAPCDRKYGWDDVAPGASRVLYAGGCVVGDETVLLVEGEPDAWLLHSLEVPACSFLCGASCVPREAVGELVMRAPDLVLVVYDHDPPGRAGAARVVRALRDAGLRASALRLPDELPEGGDVTDLYRACGGAREAFLRVLTSLPHLPVAPPAPRRTSVRPPEQRESGFAAFNRAHELVDLVTRVAPLRRQGGRWIGRCPLGTHDDHTPSFAVYEDGHFYCYGCCAWGDSYDFARRMGWT